MKIYIDMKTGMISQIQKKNTFILYTQLKLDRNVDFLVWCFRNDFCKNI